MEDINEGLKFTMQKLILFAVEQWQIWPNFYYSNMQKKCLAYRRQIKEIQSLWSKFNCSEGLDFLRES